MQRMPKRSEQPNTQAMMIMLVLPTWFWFRSSGGGGENIVGCIGGGENNIVGSIGGGENISGIKYFPLISKRILEFAVKLFFDLSSFLRSNSIFSQKQDRRHRKQGMDMHLRYVENKEEEIGVVDLLE